MIVRRRNGSIVHQLRTLYNVGTVGDLTDGQLLERFATDADEFAELAFAALVERHEAMVWRVCLAILRNEHEAEDAFQATFLVLVRRARSLWVRDSLGPWIHQVACRTASCLRATGLRRRKHERRRAENDAPGLIESGIGRDLELDAAVHEEVDRLPEKYRAPLVLCDLQGRTHQEAARFLGWPIGTVKSRQSQGRRLMRDRLAYRGFGLSVAGSVVESSRHMALAAVPRSLSQATITSAIQLSARLVKGIAVSTRVLTLTERVVQIMLWIKIRFLTVGAIAVAIGFGGAGVYVCGSQEPAPNDGGAVPKPSPSKPVPPVPPNASKKAVEEPEAKALQAKLRAQQLSTRKAKALYEIARATRQLAEIAVEEYEDLNYPKELAIVEGEIRFVESELRRAEDRRNWAGRMFDKGYISQATKASEELGFQRTKFALEQARSKQKVLTEYSRDKTLKELRSDVEKTRADELAKQTAWELEHVKEIELELQRRPKAN